MKDKKIQGDSLHQCSALLASPSRKSFDVSPRRKRADEAPQCESHKSLVSASSLQVCSSTLPLQWVMAVGSAELSASCCLSRARSQTLNSVKHFETRSVWTKTSCCSGLPLFPTTTDGFQKTQPKLNTSRRNLAERENYLKAVRVYRLTNSHL